MIVSRLRFPRRMIMHNLEWSFAYVSSDLLSRKGRLFDKYKLEKNVDRNLLIGEMIIYDELERVVTVCLERISLRDFFFLEEDRRGWKILADSQRYDKIGFVIIRVYGIRIKAASFLIEIIFLSERNKMTKVMVVNVNQLSYFVIYQRLFIVQ